MFQRQTGFSLIELFITLGIFAVLTAIGGPALGTWIKNNEVNTSVRQISSVFRYARSEAVTRNSNITVATVNGGDDWSGVITVYVDDSGGNSAYSDADDTMLKQFNAYGSEKVVIKSNAAANPYVSFNPRGGLNEGGNTIALAICDERGAGEGEQVRISLVGRVSSSNLEEGESCDPS